MRRIAPLCVLGALLLVVPALAQTSPLVGSWKENVAKGKYVPGPAPKSRTLKWETAPGGLKFTIDQVNAQGQATHSETLEKSDGSDSLIQGGNTPTMRALKRVDDHTYEDMDKVAGKLRVTRRLVISPDGKTLTVTVKGTNGQGQAVNNVEVYEKQ